MNDRSSEVIKSLNRLASDRSIPQRTRRRILEAMHHIRELQEELVKVSGAEILDESNE